MFRVLTCLAVEHDWRLVALAGALCLLTCFVVWSIYHRAAAASGCARMVWLALSSMVAGSGIWATHFIGMLAYQPQFGVGYNLTLTMASLLLAVGFAASGLAVSLWGRARGMAFAGGLLMGVGVAAMHYSGMFALEVAGRLSWSMDLVVASIALALVFAALAHIVSKSRSDGIGGGVAAILLALAIVGHHFTAMAAVKIIPDPTRTASALLLSPDTLAIVLAGIMVWILGMPLIAALADRQSSDKLLHQKHQLDAAMQNMRQGLCMFDADGRLILFNERYASMMELPSSFGAGQSLLNILRHRKSLGKFQGDPEQFFANFLADLAAGKPDSKVRQDADGRSLRVDWQPMAEGGWVATVDDITATLEAQAKIEHLARYDALTDLPNRVLFHEEMEQALRHVRRDEQIAVLCLDLDHFKNVNDTLGHPTGDALLKLVALRIKQCIRETDTVARLGGDEFAIVQVGAKRQPAEASALASRLIEAISGSYDLNGNQIVIGASIGISIAPGDGMDVDQLLKSADMALYRSKADGRGTYCFFEPEMDAEAHRRRALELDLRRALLRGEFEVYYQPIYELKSNLIAGFEALARWNHPTQGIVSPANFIPLAEETGLIVPLGDWVLRSACQQAAQWPDNVYIAVNLSPVQFKNRDLVRAVTDAITEAQIDPRRLELEITETVLLQDNETTLATLHKLHDFGVRISMDDFGTGYSSLSYLRSFPFDKIKIDQSFIEDLPNRPDSMAIVRAVTGLAQSLGIATTAEGVETTEQVKLLTRKGCTQVQGYLFSPPCRAAETSRFFHRSEALCKVA
ncbi:EAL domain-containing protein [Rhodoplanes sp. Z2-YC6860]|uniref:EAL domain-containing protein n=1 Tax=Rhodoplanes sp. Z2-YC6860 TaxID=674703 RepID=UPI00078B7B2F|nr:EAL domain-containing protein [Rhodoplanes sp. Z2-YC6860]AMN43711.1 PAS domain S-box/diguanylate cyclase (GGDEF) domain-containing protein [Rhodoplanes sp. Z2-YC6860]